MSKIIGKWKITEMEPWRKKIRHPLKSIDITKQHCYIHGALTKKYVK